MLKAIHTAATGMEAMQTNLDSIANNLANVNTTGFKRGVTQFHDLFYQTIRQPGTTVAEGLAAPTGVQVGSGVKTASLYKEFTQGAAQRTNRPLDIMIDGNGFLAVEDEAGNIVYTRDGSLQKSVNGELITSHGYRLQPTITIPMDATGVTINRKGQVHSRDRKGVKEIGQIELAWFINPSGLKAMGRNLYQLTQSSGDPVQGKPGERHLGGILSGHLEGSNVNIVNEMVHMIQVQRAYEMNSKVMQTADSMLGTTNNASK